MFRSPSLLGADLKAGGSAIVVSDGISTRTIAKTNSTITGFGPGDTLDFSQFFDTPVTEFTIVGINAPIDSTDPVAFPIQIAFNDPTADFQIRPVFVDPPVNEESANNVRTSVPEPATIWSLMGLGLAIIIGDRRRR